MLFLGSTIILSTLVLGIHWVADVAAGTAVGLLSVALARGVDHRLVTRWKWPALGYA
jgi:membrane-associated phospholipid phosphatase